MFLDLKLLFINMILNSEFKMKCYQFLDFLKYFVIPGKCLPLVEN